MPERANDWLSQARRDLENAGYNRKGAYYEWSCFVAQQSAEKALKALYQVLGGDAWGHSVFRLLEGLAEKIDVPPELMQQARELDRYYIPTRYPNGWADGAPKDFFTLKDADNAIRCAEEVLRFSDRILARS
jgi:HEPN domain-containing protein